MPALVYSRTWLASAITLNIISIGIGQKCVWQRPGNEWSTGKKLYVVIPMDKTYDSWALDFNFSSPVTALEAWKGDVAEMPPNDGTMWRITNKCYNGVLYGCQCLEVGLILRYMQYSDPSFQLDFNTVSLDICTEASDCLENNLVDSSGTTPATCHYSEMLEGDLHCELEAQLNELRLTGTAGSGAWLASIQCLYANHPTNSTSLCDLWCQIALYNGYTCAEDTCPYTCLDTKDQLCELWVDLQAITQPIAPLNTITDYSTCPHIGGPAENTACSLWCQIQQFGNGTSCQNSPQCPYDNGTFSAAYIPTLCDLWAQNKDLISGSGGSGSLSGSTVQCPYSNEPAQYSGPLCLYWCETQRLCEGNLCEFQIPCPFQSDPEEALLCQLFEQLQMLLSGSGSATISSSSDLTDVTCPYINNPTSASDLCELWCNIKELYGSVCSSKTTFNPITTTGPVDRPSSYHPCHYHPCHLDANCVPIEEFTYNCSCPTFTSETGLVSVYDNSTDNRTIRSCEGNSSGWIINAGIEYSSGFAGLTEGEIITEFLNESSFNPDNVSSGVNLELPDWSTLLGSEDDYALPDFSLFGRRKRTIWESKAYMYSFILTAKRLSDTLKNYNICALFDELKVRDDGWPQNNFTCREAQARVLHLDRLEELAYIEEKYTETIKYREHALSIPLAELKAVGSPYWEYFLYYLNVWRNDWNCIYYGHLKHDYICRE